MAHKTIQNEMAHIPRVSIECQSNFQSIRPQKNGATSAHRHILYYTICIRLWPLSLYRKAFSLCFCACARAYRSPAPHYLKKNLFENDSEFFRKLTWINENCLTLALNLFLFLFFLLVIFILLALVRWLVSLSLDSTISLESAFGCFSTEFFPIIIIIMFCGSRLFRQPFLLTISHFASNVVLAHTNCFRHFFFLSLLESMSFYR